MDLSRRPGDAIAALSALGLFAFLFVDWAGGFNGWEELDVMDVLLTVLAAAVFVLAIVGLTDQRLTLPVERGRLITYLGAVALVVIAVFLLELDDVKVGLFLSVAAAIGITYGGVTISRGPAAPRTRAEAPPAGAPPGGTPPGGAARS